MLLKILSVPLITFGLAASTFARAENAITRVGAINWDCSRPSTTMFGSYATRSLGPSRFRDRTPYYAKIVEEERIDFADRTVEDYSVELQYAIDAGIDYFAYCWYDRTPCATHLDGTSETASADAHVHELARARLLYERSPLRHKLNYCAILVVCHQYSDAELRALAMAMKEPYYEKVGSRPLVYFFMGKVSEPLARLRRFCREVGADDPYAVLMVNKPTLPTDDDLSGIQAYSAYATGGQAATYAEVAERTIQRNAGRAALGKPTIPLFSCGWDPTPRILHPVPWGRYSKGTYASPATADELVSAAARLRRWVGENAAACPTGHVLAFAWNEFEEGGWICPNIGADGKTDFIRRDAFAAAVSAMKSGIDPDLLTSRGSSDGVTRETRDVPPYGLCVHTTRPHIDFPTRAEQAKICRELGVGIQRFDLTMATVLRGRNRFDFKLADAAIDAALAEGVAVLPILTTRKDIWPPWTPENEIVWTNYIQQTVRRYRGRVGQWEIVNEFNIHGYDIDSYFKTLRSAAIAIRSADPQAKVVLGGLAGTPMDKIERLYVLGGAKYFDVMNLHLYVTHDIQNQPEGNFDIRLERVRALMTKYGDGQKPIWVTETGSCTHQETVASEKSRWNAEILREGLRQAQPDAARNRVLVVNEIPESGELEEGARSLVESTLGPSYEVFDCRPDDVPAALEGGRADVVFLSQSWLHFNVPASVLERFVAGGGVLVVCSWTPMMSPMFKDRQGVWKRGLNHELPPTMTLPQKFRFPFKRLADTGVPFADLKLPTGVGGITPLYPYFTDAGLKPGDRLIPLCEAVAPDGARYPLAAVLKFGSDWKGAVVVSAVHNRFWYPRSERRQADQLARILGICTAEGVESTFVYKLRAAETTAYNPQDHFGIVHADLSEKPACEAYRTFIAMRPGESVQSVAPWRVGDYEAYRPEWTRPDGRRAGMLWTVVRRQEWTLETKDEMSFFDVFGKSIEVRRVPWGYVVPIGPAPVYYVSAKAPEQVAGK